MPVSSGRVDEERGGVREESLVDATVSVEERNNAAYAVSVAVLTHLNVLATN